MYKHVLVAVDLSEESEFLLKKAVGVAKRNDAKLSIIHVDVNFSDLYTGLIDVNMSSMQDRISSETQKALLDLAENAGYPIQEKLSGSGDLGQVLTDAIEQYDVDLLVTGHHQDFWSKLMSSTRQVMNTIKVDMLVKHPRPASRLSRRNRLAQRLAFRRAFGRTRPPDGKKPIWSIPVTLIGKHKPLSSNLLYS